MRMTLTDDAGHFWIDGKLYKLKNWNAGTREEQLKGVHKADYVEVNPEEYDERVFKLAERIASYPQVDLVDMVRDALYDLPLVRLDVLERKLNKEDQQAKEEKRPAKVQTKRGERGTCVELRIGNRYGMELRA